MIHTKVAKLISRLKVKAQLARSRSQITLNPTQWSFQKKRDRKDEVPNDLCLKLMWMIIDAMNFITDLLYQG